MDPLTDLPEVDHPVHGAGPSTVAIMFIFGAIIFATISLGARTWLLGDYRGKADRISSSLDAVTFRESNHD